VRLTFVIGLIAAKALAQSELITDFESPIAVISDGGVWSSIFDVGAVRSHEAAAAHNSSLGVRFTRTTPVMGLAPDSQLQHRLDGVVANGDSWTRWWMRVAATAVHTQLLMNSGDTSVSAHVGLAYEPTGLVLNGYEGAAGSYFEHPAAPLPNSAWHLYELGIHGMGSPDGGLTLVIDGATVFSRSKNFALPAVGVRQLNIGLTYGDRQFLGTVDYDDVRTSRDRPAGRWRLRLVNPAQLIRVGDCVLATLTSVTSDGVTITPVQTQQTVTVASPGADVGPMGCTLGNGAVSMLTGASQAMVEIVPRLEGLVSVSAPEVDFFSSRLDLMVAPSLRVDAGVNDAGTTASDAGLVDAGVSDAGREDAGTADAGSPDGGPLDGGADDAGIFDAGFNDAGPVQSSDAGRPDAGIGRSSTYLVGCSSTPIVSWASLGVLLLKIVRRRARPSLHPKP
jgi:hypothetical protein